jgi:katanin p60 ATPase-containing subunit A1
MSETLKALKARSEARLHEEKRQVDRQRNVLTLVLRHLIDHGYVDSAERLQSEAGQSLSKYDVADNIDLLTIVHQWEDYHAFKFGKPPKIIRRTSNNSSNTQETTKKNTQYSNSSSSNRKSTTGKENEKKKSARERRNKRNNYIGHVGKGGVDGSVSTALKGKLSSLHPVHAPGLNHNYNSPNLPPTSNINNNSNNTLNKCDERQGHEGKSDMSLAGNKMDIKSAVEKNGSNSSSSQHSDSFEKRLLKPLPTFGGDSDTRALASVITRDIYQHNPGVYWDDIVELDDAKRLLNEAVVMPTKYPELFTGLLAPWKGVLLFGPPGTGKTMLARAIATECKTTFFNISASSIVSKYRGDSEKLIRVLFDLARYHAPSTIFIDEIDSIMSARGSGQEHEASRRMKTELLIQMDGLAKDSNLVFVLAASNLPWCLDMAMLRRLEKRILVPLPTEKARKTMFEKLLSSSINNEHMAKNMMHNANETANKDGTTNGNTINYDLLAKKTDGYSGADIRLVAKEAAMRPLRRLMSKLEQLNLNDSTDNDGISSKKLIDALGPIKVEDVVAALNCTKASTCIKKDKYKEWQNEYGSSL